VIRPRLSCPPRRGAVAPLTALLLIPLVAMLAFAVDMGYISHTKNELQAAADAAALAGANQLTDNFVSYYLPGVSSSKKTSLLSAASTQAKTTAKTYASYNSAGGVSSLTLLDADIELGYTAADGTYTALPTYTGYPNTVKVTLRRDSSANGSLSLFFAKALGISTVDLTATATACIYSGQIDGFQTSTQVNSRILPMTYDVNDWNSFVNGVTQSWISVDTDSLGLPRVAVYPTLSTRGNFGELSLDQGNCTFCPCTSR
jgi:Flp pilus assembly protein TadG